MFQRISLLVKFFIFAGVLFLASAVVLLFVSNLIIRQSFITRVKNSTGRDVQLAARNLLNAEDFYFADQVKTKEVFNELFQRIKTAEIIRIKVWNRQARVIFSDDESIVGKKFTDNEEFQKAVKGEVVTDFQSPVKSENISEQGYKQLVEVYVPITFEGNYRPAGVIETYFKLDNINNQINQTQYILFIATISYAFTSFIIFYFIFKTVIYKQIEKIRLQATALKTTANAVVITDTGGTIQWVNPAFTKLTGYTSKEVVGQSTRLLHSGKQNKLFYQNLWNTILSGKVWQGETINRKKDGSLYTEDQTITSVKDEKGEITNFISVKQDISERKILEKILTDRNKVLELMTKSQAKTKEVMLNILEDLEEEKVKDEAILKSIGDGLIITDNEGSITQVNKNFEKLLGWTAQEVIGKNMLDIVRKVDENDNLISPRKRSLHRVLTGELTSGSVSTIIRTHSYLRKDKSKLPVIGVVTPMKINNKIIGAIQVFRNVTHEQEIDKAKTEFVSVASHALRTPLTAIAGIVTMMLDGEYGPVAKELKEPLNDMNTSSERLIHLVNDLLNISRIQSGRMRYTLSEFSIKDVITEAIHLLQPISEQKKIKLTMTELDPITVQGDPDKVKEILNNLIGNSFKFTDKGSITVSTKVVRDKAEIHIADTGIGIAKKDQSKLFGLFQQIESGRGRPIGTGFGLHISREMIRKMGGDLWIEKSEIGKGSTFVFSIPKSESELAEKVKEEIEKEAKTHSDQKSES